MDVLADVLAITRFGNRKLCEASFCAPWGVEFEPAQRATFHIVSRGSCWLTPGNDLAPIHLLQGDIIVMANGLGHSIADHPDSPVVHYLEGANQACSMEANSPEASTTLFCGGYFFEQDTVQPLLSLLPPIIHLPADQVDQLDELQTVVRLLMRERVKELPGSSAIISRLMDTLFIYILRAWLEKQPERSAGWLGALRDPNVGKVLSLIHEKPEYNWTVDRFASEVSMSRAAFAKRFTNLVGEAPLTYVRRWRMDLAANLLRESSDAVGLVANQVGYESETAFSKVFRKIYGRSPGQYRTEWRQTDVLNNCAS